MKITEMQKILTKYGIKNCKSWNKTQLQASGTKSIKELNHIIDHHKKHAKSYFWSPPQGASARRSEENRKTFTEQIGGLFYSSEVSCSCKNYYYTGIFKFNGETKNLRIATKMIKELGEIIL